MATKTATYAVNAAVESKMIQQARKRLKPGGSKLVSGLTEKTQGRRGTKQLAACAGDEIQQARNKRPKPGGSPEVLGLTDKQQGLLGTN